MIFYEPTVRALAMSLFLGLLFMVVPLGAAAKTVYVNTDGDDSNEGSSSAPFKTLEEAAEEVNEGEANTIKLGKGSFGGEVTFEQGVSILGAGKGSTTITGGLIFKKKADLKNLSVRTKVKNAIVIGKNGVASFKNIDVRDFTGIGIWLTAGGAVLTLENSRIGSSSGKGIYAEAGSKLNISESSIVNNNQEGIDIRQNTRGTIKNNSIEGNRESGIELIVGSSDFLITGNDIKNNKASGIAYQFYALNTKSGAIIATGNTITGNSKSGVDCNQPQKGSMKAGFWADSISLEGNTFSNNKAGDISTLCKLIEAKTEEEEQALEKELVEETKAELAVTGNEAFLKRLGTIDQEQLAEENRITEELLAAAEAVIVEEQYEKLGDDSKIIARMRAFFFGSDPVQIAALKNQIEADEATISTYEEQLNNRVSYTVHPDLSMRIVAEQSKLEPYKLQIINAELEKGLLQKKFKWNEFVQLRKILYVFPL